MQKYLKNKNVIIAIVTILLIIILAFLIFRDTKEPKKLRKEDKKEMISITDPEIMKNYVVDGIDFNSVLFVIQDGRSRLMAEVTNNTGVDYKLKQYVVNIKDKDNVVLGTMHGYVGDEIKAGETKNLDVSIDRDLSKVATIEYEVEK